MSREPIWLEGSPKQPLVRRQHGKRTDPLDDHDPIDTVALFGLWSFAILAVALAACLVAWLWLAVVA